MKESFPIVLYSEASSEVKVIYDDIMASFELDFVLNYFKAQGNNSALLKGNWERIKSVLFNGTVPQIIKEEIIYRISTEQNCQYCSYIHTKVIEKLRDKITKLQGIDTDSKFSEAESSAIDLIIDLAFDSDLDGHLYHQNLLDLGFSGQQIAELISTVDLTFMLNKQAQLYGIEIDEEFLKS